MFVEGDVEIKINDYATKDLDEHELKLWLKQAFKNGCCYRVSNFKHESDKLLRAMVALSLDQVSESERVLIEGRPNDVVLLRGFIERMFEGKGSCRGLGEPKLKAS